jgi:hypothetical protein
MGSRPGGQVVHSYDIARRRVLCGWTGQSSSTKHPAGVTCTTCRELLARGLAVDRTVGSAARPGE